MRPLRVLRTAARRARRSVAEPAACPDGWSTGPPDFVGVGAQRSGTTWWYGLIADHPSVRPLAARRRRPGLRPLVPGRSIPAPDEGSLRKELHFFDSLQDAQLSPEDRALYERFFPRPKGTICGEWTPRYMLDFWTPPLLRAAAPQAKLLVLLRDPVERFQSGLAREAAVAREGGFSLPPAAWNGALDRGRYGSQLVRLLSHFPREQVLVLQYERCRAEPREQLRRTYAFLGLDPVDHAPPQLDAHVGKTAPRLEDIGQEQRRELVSALADEARGAAELFPELDLDLWPNFRHLA